MNQYNFPTVILSGRGALDEFVVRLAARAHRRVLIVTDRNLANCGITGELTRRLDEQGVTFNLFTDIDPNPVEANIEAGAAFYQKNSCDSIIALGGGSPMDAAKAIRIMAVHPFPLAQYDDALGGDQLITQPMPPLYAIPTTAGTGSEVGRSAVIIMKATGRKTIFFHPDLTPNLAVLEPTLTVGLSPAVTAATGIDALVHCLEAYLATGFHPMADGIALEGMALVLDSLPVAVDNGNDLDARERMLLAAAMGATAFQKGLGMIHSLAHPLSSRKGMHHGLANALLLPSGTAFLENAELTIPQQERLARVKALFARQGIGNTSLQGCCSEFIERVGISSGLGNHGVAESDLEALSREAWDDPCHATTMVPVTRKDFLTVYRSAL
jgi:4-hydroxybutyrate dehydrogenase